MSQWGAKVWQRWVLFSDIFIVFHHYKPFALSWNQNCHFRVYTCILYMRITRKIINYGSPYLFFTLNKLLRIHKKLEATIKTIIKSDSVLNFCLEYIHERIAMKQYCLKERKRYLTDTYLALSSKLYIALFMRASVSMTASSTILMALVLNGLCANRDLPLPTQKLYHASYRDQGFRYMQTTQGRSHLLDTSS